MFEISKTKESSGSRFFILENYGSYDVIFLLDGTDTVRNTQFQHMKNLVYNTVSGYNTRLSGTKIGLGVYGGFGSNNVGFGSSNNGFGISSGGSASSNGGFGSSNNVFSTGSGGFGSGGFGSSGNAGFISNSGGFYIPQMLYNKPSIFASLDSMSLIGGKRQMGLSLNYAVNQYGPQGNNRKVYVMFTTGNNQIVDMSYFASVSQRISIAGHELFIVALGNQINLQQFVNVIVPSRNIYQAMNINMLPDLLHRMLILNMPASG